MTDDPAAFGRRFAALWGQADAPGLADLLSEDAEMLTLTGRLGEGRSGIAEVLAGDFAGPLRGVRLVSGRAKLRPLGPLAAILTQRYVLVGPAEGPGAEPGRMAAVLTAVLQVQSEGWRAVSLTFAGLDGAG